MVQNKNTHCLLMIIWKWSVIMSQKELTLKTCSCFDGIVNINDLDLLLDKKHMKVV